MQTLICVVSQVWSNTDFDYCRASSVKLELGIIRRLIVKRTIYWLFGENIQKFTYNFFMIECHRISLSSLESPGQRFPRVTLSFSTKKKEYFLSLSLQNSSCRTAQPAIPLSSPLPYVCQSNFHNWRMNIYVFIGNNSKDVQMYRIFQRSSSLCS